MIQESLVGKRISMLRKEKQLSQEQLAERLMVSPQAVSKWETGKSLPETATLPVLSKVLGCPIDHILLPQELIVLSAVYTDGHMSENVTFYVNARVTGSKLLFPVSELTLPAPLSGGRMKLLLVKYETPAGVFYTCVPQGEVLTLDSASTGASLPEEGLRFIYGRYGNEAGSRDILNKLEHYNHFEWEEIVASHELFPSLTDNEEEDYLLVVYLNASGIHAVSCTEGGRLSYSADRTELIATDAKPDSYIVEQVPRIGFGRNMDCSWAGALCTSLRMMGVVTSYETVMGVSGACWRTAFAPVWDYSAADALAALDYATPGFRAYGFEPVVVSRISREERAAEKKRIVAAIDNHMLPIAINLRVAHEWGVITGYLDNGNTLLCRSYMDDETFTELQDDPAFQLEMAATKGYLYVDHWPFLLLHYTDAGQRPSERESLRHSLQLRLDSLHTPAHGEYRLGYAGLAAWREGLIDKAWYWAAKEEAVARRLSVNHFLMMALVDARRSAAIYLKEAAASTEFPPLAVALLQELAALYQEMHRKLAEQYAGLPDDATAKGKSAKLLWTAEARERQADLLAEVADEERRADDITRQLLAQLGD